jgi:hypothetical protein
MARKTIKVDDIRKQVNEALAGYERSSYSDEYDNTIGGQIVLLESILHSTGNYSGFRYLSKQEVPDGQKPGINDDYTFDNTDPLRRHYY